MRSDRFKFSSLHGKFLCALFLAGAIGFCGYAAQKAVVDTAQIYVHMTDIAGRQRMLSQRAALLVAAAQESRNQPGYAQILSQLKTTLDELGSNHRFLLAQKVENPGSWSQALEALYFGAEAGIDAELQQYMTVMQSFLTRPFELRRGAGEPPARDSQPANPMPTVLLGMLDRAVRHYVELLNEKILVAGRLSLLVFIIDALALLLLALFVFRPMLSRLRDEHRSLKETYRRLLDEMSERCQLDRQRAAAELKFRNAFENAPIGIGLIKPGGVLFDANPSLRRMFYPGEQATEIDFATVFDEPDRGRFFDLMREAMQSNEVRTRQLRCLDCHDDELHMMVSVSPVSEDRREIDYLVLQVQDITESHSLNTKLKRQASYDELTGLLNRRAFNKELEEAWSVGDADKESYLLIMDLDQFKVINDTSGHAAGDQLLRRVSTIIKECVRSDDLVCRLGGDEFAVLLPRCPPENAARIAETIRTSIDDLRFVWDQETYRVGASIGVVEIDPALGDISEIQQLADAACYAAKEAGRNCVQMVTEGKSEVRLHRREIRWVQRLREAMEKRRFVIYGQPIKPAQAHSGLEERTEILLRLRDPDEKRLIPPGAFLPAAERYGLNVELDEWVVSSLIELLYVQQSFGAPLQKYWVNLSGNSVGDERFAKRLLQIMKTSPLAVGTINFEITETAVIRNLSSAGRFINELRDMGCQIALDDFGSGLSSFGYLKHLPIDYLKIDGMFIKDIHHHPMNRIFVKSIIDIAHTLDIKTVAEYVEDQTIASIVTELGVDYLQGYLFGEPKILAPDFGRNAHARVI